MAAQVEVQTGEVGRTVAGGRLHLSPLTDSSNKSLIDIPSINQSHIITPEPNKPAPGPKPRLTPKPFAVDKNPTIKPILAPKPRPESTRLAGYKPELPSSPKPQQQVATVKPRPISTNPNRPSPTSFKTSNKLNTGQTTKPVVQPFKPAPPLDPEERSKPTPPVPAERQKPSASSLSYSKSLKNLPAAEWSGTTKKEDDKDNMTSSNDGVSITRAKSMGFLLQVGQEDEEKEKAKPETAVPLRPKPRGSRPRPVSAIFLDSPTQTEAPVPAPRWAGRRPLSADLTSKFESIGLSLHRQSPKENTPEETTLPQKREQEKPVKSTTPQSTVGEAKPALSDQSNKKTEEMTVKEIDEDKRGAIIKSRISLLLDSSSTPGTGAGTGQGSDLHSPVQLVPENEPAVGVKQLIKQLTEDTTPTQSPVMKPALKPRPLPLDLTKRFSSERSPDLGSISLTEATDQHEISKDPKRRNEELALTPSDHRTIVDLKDSQEQLQKASTPEGPEGGQIFAATSKEIGPSGEVQTVRASLFENVVERHSVLMVDEAKPANKPKDSLNSPSYKRGNSEDEGTLVTATYKEPASPSSPRRVLHAFDTVQAIEENRAVSENVPSAQWEDKAMTLRSRRSEGSRPVAERTGSAQAEPALVTPEQQPRYLRIGALHKWTNTGIDQDAGMEKGMPKESQREGQVAVDEDGHREPEQEEVAAAPKRLKMLQAEEQQKPRATYFALTGQIQEPVSPADTGANMGDMAVPFDDFTVRSALGGSQGKILPIRRNPSLDEAFGKTSQDQVEELMMRSHMSHREIRSALEGQSSEEIMEVEKKKDLRKETEKHKAKTIELEKQRPLEMEKLPHLEFARMKERDMQREFERQRQIAFEKEKQEFEKKQRAMEKQKQIELEKQKLQELEREKQREQERERQRQLEKEKRKELERQREIEREKLREQERERQREQERQRQREEERQRELDKERQLLEIQKEKQKMEAMARMKESERQQLLEFQKQKQKERERQQIIELEKQRLREKMEREEAEKIKKMALEQERLRLKEIDKERERQREMEREHQREMEREKQRELERQKQLDMERQELEIQRLRQREQERERQRKEEMERRWLLELERQKQAERQQLLEFEKRRLSEKMEREEAEKMRQIAKQQEAERQRLKEKQKKEEQERARLEASSLRPKVLDLDSVLRNDPFPKPTSQRSDPATRWKEPSSKGEESYKPAILDIDAFSSQTQLSPSKDLFPVCSIQGVDAGFGARLQPTPERDISWKVPSQTSASFSSPVWTTSPQDPWELRPVEMSVDTPTAEPRKQSNKVSPEQLLLRQEERLLTPQGRWSALLDDSFYLAPVPGTESKTGSAPAEPIWVPREQQPQNSKGEVRSHRRSQGSQELNRMRSRSASRRSAPSSSAVEGSLSRMRSRSAHRERDRHSWVQQKQSVGGEEEGNDSETPVRETDSQYGTWETGLRTDDSLTPATPSSESNISPSPRKPTSPHMPGDRTSQFEPDTLDGLLPPSSSDSQLLSFPDAPTALLDTSALRSRAQLGKKRAPRSRPSKAARQSAALAEGEGGTTEDWLYRDSTEAKVVSKDEDSDSEEQAREAVASLPQRVALFPGMDPSALKAQLKKRGDSDNQTDGPTPSPSQLSRSPKSPFLPRAARVLPPPGGKENGEEDSPQWLKELKSKKRLSQYENEN